MVKTGDAHEVCQNCTEKDSDSYCDYCGIPLCSECRYNTYSDGSEHTGTDLCSECFEGEDAATKPLLGA
jgi:hypothetical protein